MFYAIVAVVAFVAGGAVTHFYEGRVIKQVYNLEDRLKAWIDTRLSTPGR